LHVTFVSYCKLHVITLVNPVYRQRVGALETRDSFREGQQLTEEEDEDGKVSILIYRA
jgi:hypothetical protein